MNDDGTTVARYDGIGHGDGLNRREDALLAKRIHDALGAATTVVNVEAGTGSYEPRDRHVIAVEPSDLSASQWLRCIHPLPGTRSSS